MAAYISYTRSPSSAMSQWQQPGYQYPMQTGLPGSNPQFQQNPQQNQQFQQQNPQFQQPQNPQFLQQQTPSLLPQQTGYVPPRPQGYQQPQQTGYAGAQQGFLQSQPTGYVSGGFQQRPAPPPPVPALPSQFQGQATSNFLAPQQPNRSFLSTSPGPGLMPQATGLPGGQRPLVAQPTGFVDPRLQMMSSSFMPLNASSPYGSGGAPQLQPQHNLQQSFQQVQAQKPRISWALGKAEKKSYDAIFRAWDTHNTGFISGQTALEVFGQSGLGKDDLARIWTLADIDDRGKLNVAEFHVAMGLIYRRLNGNEIPDVLPPELLPPSSRDLTESVDLIRNILKNDTRARTPSNADAPLSYRPSHSFSGNNNTDPRKDATIYVHNDTRSAYKPASRHVDRDAVRATSELDSPSADLSDVKRALQNGAQMLDRAAARTAEDDALARELEDLKYRVERVNEDLAYAARPPRSAAKDDERRRLERELLELMHVRVPEVERKIEQQNERRERDKRDQIKERDRRNERFGRFSDRDDERDRYEREQRDRGYERDRERDRDRDYDRPYSRGSYGRDDRDFDRGNYRRPSPALRDSERDLERDRDRDRDYDRDRDRDRPERPRSTQPPPAAPSPTQSRPSPAPATKNMTPEERQAFARAEAKRRVDARMAALGVTPSPSSGPGTSPTPTASGLDSSIEERLAAERREAEEKARVASQQAEEREAARRERLANEKALKEGRETPAAPPPAPTPTVKAAPPAPTPTPKAAPPPPKPKAAPPPPKPRQRVAPPPAPAAPAPPPPPPAPAVPEVDPEEEALRAREEALRKQREARAERLRQLEREEEEAARAEEERLQARIRARNAQAQASVAASAASLSSADSVASLSTRSPSPVLVAAPTPPPPAAATPVTTPPEKSKTNPFSRLMNQGGGGSAASTPPVSTPSGASTNPWASATSAVASPPPPPAPPAPAFNPPRANKNPFPAYNTASSSIEDDWEPIKENESDDDSDDSDGPGSRLKRENIAKQLFSNILPSAPLPRPQSAAANSRSGTPATPVSAGAGSGAPPPPPPPPPGPPAPPPPPAAPPAPAAPAAAPAGAGDVSALMRSIQGGMKLRKTVTVDKSAAPGSGKVLGDSAPPTHINAAAPRAPSPEYIQPPVLDSASSSAISNTSSNRQSVDWYAGLAADASPPVVDRMPSMREEYEEPYSPPPPAAVAPIPDIHVESVSDLMADIDKSTELRVRSLYAYEADGAEDISFPENAVLIANPSKTNGDWWYGKLVSNGKGGMFPKTYVQEITTMKAKALYAYTAGNDDELSFSEGETLSIVDASEEEWWKAERNGAVFIVPAGYLEVAEAG